MTTTPAETLDAGVARAPGDTEAHGSRYGTPQLLARGANMGRYVILRTLGAGGMGAVYLGYDPELDRKVALKLLRDQTSPKNRQALLREAQAMAQLAHPNVLTVHDVGEHGGRVYIAMEFVEGGTLAQWLRAGARPWREVLEMFLHAGRGLQAAHERELIHRDFKPDNVMVSSEGHVLVMDFGLARPSTIPTDEDAELASFRESKLSVATEGRLAGTPAYMAPEQVKAENLGPATDQFAFCVSLWEGVCAERPFEGVLIGELFINTSEGRVRPPPAAVRMPRWLERVLRRGLEPDPRDRWPSMASLLAALERGRRRWRWQLGLGGLAMLAVTAGTAIGWQQQRARALREQVAACEAKGAEIDEIWNDEARARLRAGLLGTGASFAQDSVDTLNPWLDDYRDAWSSGRTEACLHGTVQRDWDEDLHDRAAWCFEDRRLALEATVEQIATSNPAAARRAVRLASYLDPVATCLDPNTLRRLPVPPREQRDEIRSIRAILNESDGLRHAGKYGEALVVAEQARARAEALEWPPLLATARFIEGRCLLETGQFEPAEVALTKAYFQAHAAGSVEVAFRAARSLVSLLPSVQRHREAELWARHADVLSSELEDPSGLDEAEGHYLLSRVYLGLGDYEAAAKRGEQAWAMRAEALGADHPITVAAIRELGQVYLTQERPREALELFERSFAIWEDAVGPEHPYVGKLAMLRGSALVELGRIDEALALQREGLAICERVLRPDHPMVALGLQKLGEALAARGSLDEAARAHERALAIRYETLGPRDPLIATGLLSLADVDRKRGRYEVALERCGQALELLERSLAPGHPDIASAVERTADVYRDMGQHDEAVQRRRQALARRESARGPDDRQLMTPLVRLGDLQREGAELDAARGSYERALAIGERALGEADPALVASLTGLAEVALAKGEVGSALHFATRAAHIAEQENAGPRMAAGAHFVLARALRASGDPERRASSLGLLARSEYATHHDEVRRTEVDRWLAGGCIDVTSAWCPLPE